MTDWAALYQTAIAPVLAQHARPVPRPVLGVAAGAVVVGGLLFGLLPSPSRFSGLVLIFIVLFGVIATLQKRRAARQGLAWIRTGAVVGLRIDAFLNDDTRTGATQRRDIYVVELAVALEGPLTPQGAHLRPTPGVQRLTTSEEIYRRLAVGDALTTLSLPTARGFIYQLVDESSC